MRDAEAMHSNLLSSSFDVLQLVLRLHAHILNLANRLVYMWDLSLLCSLRPLCCNLQSSQPFDVLTQKTI